MLADRPPGSRGSLIHWTGLDFGAPYAQHPRQLLPVDQNWHKRWNLFIISVHYILVLFFFGTNDVLSLSSFVWWSFKACSSVFYFFLLIFFPPRPPGEFTELRFVIVILKSAFPAKPQTKSEFQVQTSHCLQSHCCFLPLPQLNIPKTELIIFLPEQPFLHLIDHCVY